MPRPFTLFAKEWGPAVPKARVIGLQFCRPHGIGFLILWRHPGLTSSAILCRPLGAVSDAWAIALIDSLTSLRRSHTIADEAI